MHFLLKVKGSIVLVLMFLLFISSFAFLGKEPWKPGQLIEPEELAKLLTDTSVSNDPVILNIGPAGSIKGAVTIGSVDEAEGMELLKKAISGLSKDEKIVLYCGCCPFEHCPNIRPAFSLLSKMGFKNHLLLDLPQNLKVDWIDKGFPTE